MGTSNVHLAMKYGLKPIGSMPHEIFSATAILESINHANRYVMKNWQKVYGNQLGIVLTDTFGVDAFLKDFDYDLASSFSGCRQDSGVPIVFAEKIIAHYKKLGIDPRTKTIVFSDSLDIDKAVEINKFCREKINCCFGIGTAMSNDIPGSPPLNIVIKLDSVENQKAIKLSDVEGKETGDAEMVKIYKKIYGIGE
jgi:nicotinate phosphoribosyltransferase